MNKQIIDMLRECSKHPETCNQCEYQVYILRQSRSGCQSLFFNPLTNFVKTAYNIFSIDKHFFAFDNLYIMRLCKHCLGLKSND
jgi:hypothetical protein